MRVPQFVSLMVMLTVSLGVYAESFTWVSIGESELGPWQVYVDKSSLHTDAQGHRRVTVLDDHGVTQEGIDLIDSQGEMFYDTRYKHRSSISEYVLDCEKEREVLLRTRYFSGDMGGGRLVFENRDSKPVWTDILFFIGARFIEYTCDHR